MKRQRYPIECKKLNSILCTRLGERPSSEAKTFGAFPVKGKIEIKEIKNRKETLSYSELKSQVHSINIVIQRN